LEEIERQHFIQVLRKTRGVIEGPQGAARLLDLKPSTARFRIKKLGIRREHYES
jgi:transcriptional regulator with GAF, ATPase, and Fis domain